MGWLNNQHTVHLIIRCLIKVSHAGTAPSKISTSPNISKRFKLGLVSFTILQQECAEIEMFVKSHFFSK